MILPSLFASFHYLALGIGLGSLFMRGVYFRKLKSNPAATSDFDGLLIADNFWGIAALLWIFTGVTRVFTSFEKGPDYYLHNQLFYVKMALFLLVFVLELFPMIALIKARIHKTRTFTPTQLNRFIGINNAELVLIFVIPVVASLMARGIGFPGRF